MIDDWFDRHKVYVVDCKCLSITKYDRLVSLFKNLLRQENEDHMDNDVTVKSSLL